MEIGIEAINAYVARTSVNVREIFDARGLDQARFDNLMMEEKSVNLPCEDSVTNAVNAAKPLVEALDSSERDKIELVIVGTESGLDFGKPISTYVQDYLGLSRNCRSFEVKHACYGGTAALQSALALIQASPREGARALVIASDAASATARNTYWEPSQGAGAVAMLVSREPAILEIDPGANGYCSYEVMDTCRPGTGVEAGDADLSLLSYLECLEGSYTAYRERVADVDIAKTFDFLVLHSPFAGMVKGAHRRLMRKHTEASASSIEADFSARVADSLDYCTKVGNVYSAALYLGLCSLIDRTRFGSPKRVGLFSYGSGCASEFYSGVIPPGASERLAKHQIGARVSERYVLSMSEYEALSDLHCGWMFGVENRAVELAPCSEIYQRCFAGRDLLVLRGVKNFHREYLWS